VCHHKKERVVVGTMRLAIDILVCEVKSPELEVLLQSLLDCDSTGALCAALDATNLNKYNLNAVRIIHLSTLCLLVAIMNTESFVFIPLPSYNTPSSC